jgi:hypothetical protein
MKKKMDINRRSGGSWEENNLYSNQNSNLRSSAIQPVA